MGNASTNTPLMDERVLQTRETLELTPKEIQSFWKLFCKCDKFQEGMISIDNFFWILLEREERTEWGESIFHLILNTNTNQENKHHISFGEFIQAVCTFAMFQV